MSQVSQEKLKLLLTLEAVKKQKIEQVLKRSKSLYEGPAFVRVPEAMKVCLMAETFAGMIIERFVGEEGFRLHEVEHEIQSSVSMASMQVMYKLGRARVSPRVAHGTPIPLATTLFTDDGRTTELGSRLGHRVYDELRRLLDPYLEQGHSPRDLACIVKNQIEMYEVSSCLSLQSKLRES